MWGSCENHFKPELFWFLANPQSFHAFPLFLWSNTCGNQVMNYTNKRCWSSSDLITSRWGHSDNLNLYSAKTPNRRCLITTLSVWILRRSPSNSNSHLRHSSGYLANLVFMNLFVCRYELDVFGQLRGNRRHFMYGDVLRPYNLYKVLWSATHITW